MQKGKGLGDSSAISKKAALAAKKAKQKERHQTKAPKPPADKKEKKKRKYVCRKGNRQGHSGKRHSVSIVVPKHLNLKPLRTGIYRVKITVEENEKVSKKIVEIRSCDNLC